MVRLTRAQAHDIKWIVAQYMVDRETKNPKQYLKVKDIYQKLYDALGEE